MYIIQNRSCAPFLLVFWFIRNLWRHLHQWEVILSSAFRPSGPNNKAYVEIAAIRQFERISNPNKRFDAGEIAYIRRSRWIRDSPPRKGASSSFSLLDTLCHLGARAKSPPNILFYGWYMIRRLILWSVVKTIKLGTKWYGISVLLCFSGKDKRPPNFSALTSCGKRKWERHWWLLILLWHTGLAWATATSGNIFVITKHTVHSHTLFSPRHFTILYTNQNLQVEKATVSTLRDFKSGVCINMTSVLHNKPYTFHALRYRGGRRYGRCTKRVHVTTGGYGVHVSRELYFTSWDEEMRRSHLRLLMLFRGRSRHTCGQQGCSTLLADDMEERVSWPQPKRVICR